MSYEPLVEIELENLHRIGRGKVRDIFETEDHLLLVATDRISAFDYVLPTPIPGKGMVLTQLSLFWFRLLDGRVSHHLVTDDMTRVKGLTPAESDRLQGRALLVKKAEPLPAEFIVRGYLAGSGWKDYQKTGSICGLALPPKLKESDRLDPPILTPSTKAEQGEHDENISKEKLAEIISPALARETERLSLEIYSLARDHALERGIILCDTKFEFGLLDGRVTLIDEVLTPDSSRFWPKDRYEPGRAQDSYDKQYVRDHLLGCGWDRKSPPPELPPEVVSRTTEKYEEALSRLTSPPA
jgi:phosphoribosylaminoimidazole-succinocarboxamide synthase